MDPNNSSVVREIEDPMDDLSLHEAWNQAYPEPREFMLFFVKKLKFYDERDQAMMINLLKCQEELRTLIKWEGEQRVLQQDFRDSQIEVLKTHELLAKERDKYNSLAHRHQQLQLDYEDAHRKYHAVCYLTRTSDRDVAHFFQRNPKAERIIDQMSQVKHEIESVSHYSSNKYTLANPITLGKKLEALQKQIPVMEELCRVKLNDLKDRYNRDKEQIESRFESMHKATTSSCQRNSKLTELVFKSMEDNLDLQISNRENEKNFASERERLIKMVAVAHNQRFNSSMSPNTMLKTTVDNSALVKTLKEKLSRLDIQFLEKSNIADKYSAQLLWMKRDVERHTIQAMSQIQTNKSDRRKFTEKIKVLEKRIADDEKRRKLEGAGFREDVKNLKKTLAKLECTIKSLDIKSTVRSGISHFPEVTAKRCVSAPVQNLEGLQIHRKMCSRTAGTLDTLEEDEVVLERIAETYENARDKVLRLAKEIRESIL